MVLDLEKIHEIETYISNKSLDPAVLEAYISYLLTTVKAQDETLTAMFGRIAIGF